MSPTSQRLHWNAGGVAPAKDGGRGWAVVAAAFIGLLLSVGVLVVYSFGVLISAMSAEFGWGSVERSTLFAAFSLSATVGGVLWGVVADRRGGRFTVLLSSVLLAVSFLALSVMPGNPVAMHLLFALIGLLGSGTLPPTFASVVVGWFDRHRGLALGISMTGVGAGAALLPPIAAALTTDFGWRNTYAVFAVAILLLMMPIAWAMLRQHPDAPAQRGDAPVRRREALRAAAREGRTWILGLFALLTGAILVTSVATFVPILQSRGETVTEAATREGRFGDKVAAWIHEVASERDDLAFEIVDLRDYPLPLFDEAVAPIYHPAKNEVAQRLSATMAELDGYIFITAEYNHAPTGALKNAIDFLYPELGHKPAAFVGYGGVGGARAVEQLRLILIELRAAPLRDAVHIALAELIAMRSEGKTFSDFPYLTSSAGAMLNELAWWAKALLAARQQAH